MVAFCLVIMGMCSVKSKQSETWGGDPGLTMNMQIAFFSETLCKTR